ncbi:MAG: efflux RND transporter periplasmic adaptor subunit [Bacteroidota bacterium]
MKKSTINTAALILLSLVLGGSIGYFLKGQATSNDSLPTEASVHLHAEDASHSTTFTCSMHPQIRQTTTGLCPICEMELIPLSINTADDPLVLEMTKAAVQLANIQTTQVGSGSQTANDAIIQLSGKVQADERLASSQVAHLAGRIEKLYVSFEGEQVQEGQKLADLYSPELIAAQRELLEAKQLANINPNLLEAARNKLKYWKIGAEAIKAIEESGEIQATFPLYAQASGVVMKRRVAVGDHLRAGEVLFDLMNLNKVWVLFDAYEEDLAKIKTGSPIEFSTPALPNRVFKSRVTFIDPIIDPNTRTAAVRTEIRNTNQQLKPEMFVNGKLAARSVDSKQITIPKTALLWTGKRSVVYVKVPNTKIPSFQYREVEIGASTGDNYQIISGLEVGEEVVTYGNFTIDAAAQLNNQASMMNQKVNIKGENPKAIPDYQASTPTDFQQQLSKLTAAYLKLKDALVSTNVEATSIAAKKILDDLAQINAKALQGDAQNYWKQQEQAIQAHASNILQKMDIEKQRQQFEFLSIAMINTLTAFGTSDEVIYVQHCPMAFDNQGADWLAAEEDIRNPYFGDLMMKCGMVKERIEAL